jgi:hypothetical protein
VEARKPTKVCIAAAIVAVSMTALIPAMSSGATYEPEPAGFCRKQTVHDFLRPFKRMPRLNAPRPDGTLPFGPGDIHAKVRPQLITEEGYIGFTIFRERREAPLTLNWTMRVALSRVDWRGRKLRRVDTRQQQIDILAYDDRAGGAVGTTFLPPGAYRQTVTFFDGNGRRVGGFGTYYRILAPRIRYRLRLDAVSYRPGATLFARVENTGTVYLEFPAQFRIERFENGAWSEAPESPERHSGTPFEPDAGTAIGCNAFDVPPTMRPGRYRLVKEVTRTVPPAGFDPIFEQASAEFEVLP